MAGPVSNSVNSGYPSDTAVTPSSQPPPTTSRRSSMSSQEPAYDDLLESEREIKCPIHGYIPVSPLITSIIDTPQFQRLRYLKQLGTSDFVWPGASHNRFEHSLGVYHLSSMMVNRLRSVQPLLKITDRDVRCVEVAGLCHDIGHGPFSHIWDNHFIPVALPGVKWKHEDASEMMLGDLVKKNNINLTPDEVDFIRDLIAGFKKHTLDHTPPEKDFLFEIVANKRNGIDVDKFDYIARDTHAVLGSSKNDLLRLINSARVIDGQICYSEKNATAVYNLFQERFKLHKTIYNHKTAKSIEFMVVDALILADPYLRISERIHMPEKFVHLNDSILLEVERSECPELEPARKIISRIRSRDLYKLIDKEFLPWDKQAFWKAEFTPARVVQTAKSLVLDDDDADVRSRVADLKEEHVIVDMTALHHGMGDKFPLENCKFYGKYNPGQAFPPRREADISHLLPKTFGEVWRRVFARESRFFGVIQRAARALHDAIMDMTADELLPTTPRLTDLPESSLGDDRRYPKTPSAHSSMASIGSGTGAGAGTGTPLHHNHCMTVPVGFTPKPKTPAARSKARKRAQEKMEGIPEAYSDGDGDGDEDRSPSRKKKKMSNK